MTMVLEHLVNTDIYGMSVVQMRGSRHTEHTHGEQKHC